MDIGGKSRPVWFGMNAWIDYCKLHDITITEMGDELQRIGQGGGTGAEIRDLVWAVLKCGALKEKQPFDHSPEDVGFWLDEVSSDELAGFFMSLTDSMQSKIPKENGTPAKKKRQTIPQ